VKVEAVDIMAQMITEYPGIKDVRPVVVQPFSFSYQVQMTKKGKQKFGSSRDFLGHNLELVRISGLIWLDGQYISTDVCTPSIVFEPGGSQHTTIVGFPPGRLKKAHSYRLGGRSFIAVGSLPLVHSIVFPTLDDMDRYVPGVAAKISGWSLFSSSYRPVRDILSEMPQMLLGARVSEVLNEAKVESWSSPGVSVADMQRQILDFGISAPKIWMLASSRSDFIIWRETKNSSASTSWVSVATLTFRLMGEMAHGRENGHRLCDVYNHCRQQGRGSLTYFGPELEIRHVLRLLRMNKFVATYSEPYPSQFCVQYQYIGNSDRRSYGDSSTLAGSNTDVVVDEYYAEGDIPADQWA